MSSGRCFYNCDNGLCHNPKRLNKYCRVEFDDMPNCKGYRVKSTKKIEGKVRQPKIVQCRPKGDPSVIIQMVQGGHYRLEFAGTEIYFESILSRIGNNPFLFIYHGDVIARIKSNHSRFADISSVIESWLESGK